MPDTLQTAGSSPYFQIKSPSEVLADMHLRGIPFNPPQCPTGLLGSIGIISVCLFFFLICYSEWKKRVIWNLEWIWNLPLSTQDLAELEFQLEFNGCGWGRATWRSSLIKYLYLVIIWFAELSQWSQKLRQLFLHCCWYNGEVILWAKSWETEVLWAYFQGPKPTMVAIIILT